MDILLLQDSFFYMENTEIWLWIVGILVAIAVFLLFKVFLMEPEEAYKAPEEEIQQLDKAVQPARVQPLAGKPEAAESQQPTHPPEEGTTIKQESVQAEKVVPQANGPVIAPPKGPVGPYVQDEKEELEEEVSADPGLIPDLPPEPPKEFSLDVLPSTNEYELVDYDTNMGSKGKGKIKREYLAFDKKSGEKFVVVKLRIPPEFQQDEVVQGSIRIDRLQLADTQGTVLPDGYSVGLVRMDKKADFPKEKLRILQKPRRNEISFLLKLTKDQAVKLPEKAESGRVCLLCEIEGWDEKIETSYEFFFGEKLGNTWVGLDPGTSYTCMAMASKLDFENRIFLQKDNSGEIQIPPSVITLKTDEKNIFTVEDIKLNLKTYKEHAKDLDGRVIRVGVNLRRTTSTDNFNNVQIFSSIKKLLGSTEELAAELDNGRIMKVKGRDLVSILLYKLYEEFSSYLKNEADKAVRETIFPTSHPEPKRAVVALPNNFTRLQIHDMVQSVMNMGIFKEVRYIHESEAVLMYVHAKKDKLKNGNVLVFDMGGATINATLVNIGEGSTAHKSNGRVKKQFEIKGKVGYAVGGDSIDYCIAQQIFEVLSEFEDRPHPDFKHGLFPLFKDLGELSVQEKNEHLNQRKLIQGKVILPLKIRLIQSQHKNGVSLYDDAEVGKSDSLVEIETNILRYLMRYSELEITEHLKQRDRGYPPYFLEIYSRFSPMGAGNYSGLNASDFKTIIYESVRQATKDILSQKNGISQIDHIIFSGRSVFFPGVKEAVLETIGEDPAIQVGPHAEIWLDEVEAKTAVAQGACLAGMMDDRVELSSNRTFYSYGYAFENDNFEMAFQELIPAGTPFDKTESDEIRKVKGSTPDDVDLEKNYRVIHYFQIMGPGENAGEIVKDITQKHRRRLIGMQSVDAPVSQVSMTVYENEYVEGAIRLSTTEIIRTLESPDEIELAKQEGEHATWLLQ